MSHAFYDPDVKCPMYQYTRVAGGDRKIICEGLVEGSTIQINYRKKKDLEQQMEVYCKDFYKCCEIYRMLMEAKY